MTTIALAGKGGAGKGGSQTRPSATPDGDAP